MDGLGELRPPEVQLSKPRPGTVNCALTPHKGFHHRRMWQIVTIDLWSQCVTTQRGSALDAPAGTQVAQYYPGDKRRPM
jgi:hypothetical protein